MKKYSVLLIACVLIVANLHAQLSLPAIFTDNMVLQREAPIPIWGWAKANEKVEVRLNKQTKSTKADKTGKWMLYMDAEKAGGPYTLQVKGKNMLEFKNVLIGEVWLCGGQSNMEFQVGYTGNWQMGVMNYKKEVANANYPKIRRIKIEHKINSIPENQATTTGWSICDTGTVSYYSAVSYFFARTVYDSIQVPIGIIDDNWGGTNIETWISREGFESSEEFKEMIGRMPRIHLDSLSKLSIRGSEKRIERMQGTLFSELNPKDFHQPQFDDSKWQTLIQPGLWEAQVLGQLDGVVWLRKTITLSAEEANQDAVLHLAKIDDNDETYVNSVKVGGIDRWNADRIYTLAPGILKEGKNVIAVRVIDTGGGGGIYGSESEVKISLGQKDISLAGDWKWQVESILKLTNENSLPSLCYNAMIHPIVPYGIRGVLWYQGESNAGRAYQYRKAMPLLIADWRKKFGKPDMPFYYVQLATYTTYGNSNEGCDWAELREAQALTLSVPNTGMVVTTDVGDPTDIHPTNKQTVGIRLAAIALNNLYGKSLVCRGPNFKDFEVNANVATISFNNTEGGLYTPDKYGYIRGFEIAGNDSVFHFAKAFIKGDKIQLYSDMVQNPIAVRFSWIGDASESNLFNKEGFPAEPFRTDQWKTITKTAKYNIEIDQ